MKRCWFLLLAFWIFTDDMGDFVGSMVKGNTHRGAT